ncbi:hypothetical protein C8250_021745 [Streptomyces sp. So13.3]|uniref:hypothetical protein n=1 Tax=Streptomyces sp. So13.3 TaxID=2136173 RepID=UPI00110601A1|nr:hypothetical protein [Streptomyces sp. So13.3]QNA74182.1 hypothetical protein C8250_021745 [Streptomyces sp. So13.3]
MTLSISAVLLFGVAAVFALKVKSTSFGAALVLFLFGFFAASTGASGPINDAFTSFAHFIASLRA